MGLGDMCMVGCEGELGYFPLPGKFTSLFYTSLSFLPKYRRKSAKCPKVELSIVCARLI